MSLTNQNAINSEIVGVALVAELVDALASGASFRKEVEVRVFSRAPKKSFQIESRQHAR